MSEGENSSTRPILLEDFDNLHINEKTGELFWEGRRVVTDILTPFQKWIALIVALVTIVSMTLTSIDVIAKWLAPKKSTVCEVEYSADGSATQSCLDS